MKTKSIFSMRLALCGAATLFSHNAIAQGWQTVDDFQYVGGQPAVNVGLTVAPSGILFASGWGNDAAGVSHGLVMASTDAGNSWSAPLDDFLYPGETNTRYGGGIVADWAGNLYVVGWSYGSSGPDHQFVRRSTDGGAIWSIVDDIAIPSPYSAYPLRAGEITTDAAGNVYVTELGGTWTVRKGIGGANFSTMDTFQPSASQANAVFAHPTAGVFAAGSANGVWVVRRSLNGSATWQTVDTFQLPKGNGTTAYGIGADAHGNLYVVGRAFAPYKGNSYAHWLVRKSANGGASWSTVDDYQLFTTGDQVALGFGADSLGNLYIAGWASSTKTGGTYHWVLRKNPGGTRSWATTDDFLYASSAEVFAIAADGSGNGFVGGQGSPASGSVHWLVRKH